jgi:alanyl-tRNA synthetase
LTERIYYNDSYRRLFRARIEDVSPDGRAVYLNETAFYPSSGGQPFDTGTLGAASVVDVVDEGERIAHIVEGAAGKTGDEVEGAIDWARRFDHMQQHTGQHLLSATFVDELGAATVSFHLGDTVSTIELDIPSLDAEAAARVERRTNERVMEAHPVTVAFRDASEDLGLRKATERTGMIRLVEIDGLDRSACGGTHVRSTAEIGCVLLRKQEKIRGRVRIEFVCGHRALKTAREDFGTLTEAARVLATPMREVPAGALALKQRLEEAEKARRKLAGELATARGLRAWEEAQAGDDGKKRRVVRAAALDEEVRAEATAFTSRPGALYLALCESPAAVLLAVSEDVRPTAGERIKQAIADLGGRGGGSARMAQASLSDAATLRRAEELLLNRAS